jgi:single-strand DNA-binding protein
MALEQAVVIIGTLTRDPEVKFLPSGVAVCEFGIARNTRKKEGDDWVDGPAQFYDVKCWNSLAENVGDSLAKGNRVVVFGELDYRTWEKDGQNRSKVEIKAESVGPDLRWATADVTKTTSSGGGQRQNTGGGNATAGGAPNPFAGGAPAANPFGGGQGTIGYDEEPPFRH